MSPQKNWEKEASHPAEYHCCEARRGREFILRLNTGADPVLAIQEFARENGIRFGKVHAAFMGGFAPAKFLIWAPDSSDPENWHHESVATLENLSMLLALGGMIGIRKNHEGEEEAFVAMHFVTGGAWDAPTTGGHLVEGTRVKGAMEFYVTEILGIEVLLPEMDPYHIAHTFPENWYRSNER